MEGRGTLGRAGPGLQVADEGGRGAGARGSGLRCAFGIESLGSLPTYYCYIIIIIVVVVIILKSQQ